LNAQVLGVSGDSIETHRKFAQRHGITFPLLRDRDKKIRRAYGGGRITYLIDQEGIIRFVGKGVPDNHELLNELKKIDR